MAESAPEAPLTDSVEDVGDAALGEQRLVLRHSVTRQENPLGDLAAVLFEKRKLLPPNLRTERRRVAADGGARAAGVSSSSAPRLPVGPATLPLRALISVTTSFQGPGREPRSDTARGGTPGEPVRSLPTLPTQRACPKRARAALTEPRVHGCAKCACLPAHCRCAESNQGEAEFPWPGRPHLELRPLVVAISRRRDRRNGQGRELGLRRGGRTRWWGRGLAPEVQLHRRDARGPPHARSLAGPALGPAGGRPETLTGERKVTIGRCSCDPLLNHPPGCVIGAQKTMRSFFLASPAVAAGEPARKQLAGPRGRRRGSAFGFCAGRSARSRRGQKTEGRGIAADSGNGGAGPSGGSARAAESRLTTFHRENSDAEVIVPRS